MDAREHEHYGRMLPLLEARALRKDRKAVEEEELEEHPLLPNSVMHYLSFPHGREDFPGLDERMDQWDAWLQKGQQEAKAEGKWGFNMDHRLLLPVLATQERMQRYQMDFMELVVSKPNQHIVGYWIQAGQRHARDAMMCMCAHTRPQGIYLEENAECIDGRPFVFSYAELDVPDGQLLGVISRIREFGLQPVFYLMYPSVAKLLIIHTRFPEARIIAIVTPSPTVEAQCLEVLRAKLGIKKK